MKKKRKATLSMGCDDKFTGIHVGPDAESVKMAHDKIMNILNSKNDQKTIRLALEVFGQSLGCDNAVISNCVVTGMRAES